MNECSSNLLTSLPYWIGLCTGIGFGSVLGILLNWITWPSRRGGGEE